MKDIKDYFSSPPKKKDVNSEDSVVPVIEVEPESDKNGDTSRKKRRKKKKRKVSDPAVRDVTELLSENLKFSPNNSGHTKRASGNGSFIKALVQETSNSSDSPTKMKENKPDNCRNGLIKESKLKNISNKPTSAVKLNLEGNNNEKKTLEVDVQETSDDLNSAQKSNKVNAFQFLMDRRNKSIGLNSPGKELDKDFSVEEQENKEKLAARRDLFMNWSEQKGSAKRKRLEEEKDEIIDKKLRVRAKRLKKLLKVEGEEFEKSEKVPRRKRVAKIESSSEDSDFEVVKVKQDITEDQSSKKEKNRINKEVKEDKKVEIKKKRGRPRKNEDKNLPKEANDEINKTKKHIKDCKVDDKSIEKSPKDNYTKEDNKDNQKEKNTANLKVEINNKLKKAVKTKAGSMLAFITTDKVRDVDVEAEIINETVENKTNLEENITRKKRKYMKKSKRKKSKSNSKVIALDDSSRDTVIFTKVSKETDHLEVESSTGGIVTCTRRSSRLKIQEDKNENEKSTRNSKVMDYAENSTSEESDTVEILALSADEKKQNVPKKNVKLAPIFCKAIPKPKEDPAVVEARKQFLLSGLPSELKKTIEKQNSIIEQQNTFPITQHIQQRCDSAFWALPHSELQLVEVSPLAVDYNIRCEQLTKSNIIRSINIDTEMKKVDKLKVLLNKIKAENPNYPVYKSFRQIHEKSGRKLDITEDDTKTHERKRKRNKKKKEKEVNQTVEVLDQKTDTESVEYSMWTEKYKPKCSNDIIGNALAVKSLKIWLEDWKQFSQEINSKKRRRSSTSESEFEKTDSDSRESSNLPGKIIVLSGPCGSGKTTTVYALCNELGFNVIELNASSKRTGKRLLQELQEATQSHQVRNKESQLFQTFFKSNSQTEKKSNSQTEKPENSSKKMCVLLIEDVDVVFEHDDGFISALLQLSTTSKRPIIATTTDYTSFIVQKFLGIYEYIEFVPLSSFLLSTWLQIVFLVEGLYVSQDEIGSLLEYYKGDVRKTLLQFQFWVQSGGQLQRNPPLIKLEYKKTPSDEQLDEDEKTGAADEEKCTEDDVFEHKQCLESFEILERDESFRVPFYLNLGLLWWNLPSILNIPDVSVQRIHYEQNDDLAKEETGKDLKQKTIKQIESIGKVYDALSHVDVTFRKNSFFSPEPLKRFSLDVKDSLELSETLNSYSDLEFVHELTHSFVNGCISHCGTVNRESCGLNVTMPDKIERRWRTKIDKCEDAFNEALPMTTDRRAAALDYMPALRNITRSESVRAANNTKRGNRFRYYLRDVGIKYNDGIIKSACEILNSVE
ncbi:ATPase family AAA domain-containing protein 5 [Diabrotica virgifera virgifera]|uniref:AAA+ ATPase domain-containing protein n=1 Tax=Diabrotica virgifera virgifera TaxID=50390 RepID=A0ABM5JNP9_DIAVI|nr:ATPase family AAA domain-containing protein 5 [Diabrotica virgifera virgifera]